MFITFRSLFCNPCTVIVVYLITKDTRSFNFSTVFLQYSGVLLVGQQEGHPACKNLGDELLVVMI